MTASINIIIHNIKKFISKFKSGLLISMHSCNKAVSFQNIVTACDFRNSNMLKLFSFAGTSLDNNYIKKNFQKQLWKQTYAMNFINEQDRFEAILVSLPSSNNKYHYFLPLN